MPKITDPKRRDPTKAVDAQGRRTIEAKQTSGKVRIFLIKQSAAASVVDLDLTTNGVNPVIGAGVAFLFKLRPDGNDGCAEWIDHMVVGSSENNAQTLLNDLMKQKKVKEDPSAAYVKGSCLSSARATVWNSAGPSAYKTNCRILVARTIKGKNASTGKTQFTPKEIWITTDASKLDDFDTQPVRLFMEKTCDSCLKSGCP